MFFVEGEKDAIPYLAPRFECSEPLKNTKSHLQVEPYLIAFTSMHKYMIAYLLYGPESGLATFFAVLKQTTQD